MAYFIIYACRAGTGVMPCFALSHVLSPQAQGSPAEDSVACVSHMSGVHQVAESEYSKRLPEPSDTQYLSSMLKNCYSVPAAWIPWIEEDELVCYTTAGTKSSVGRGLTCPTVEIAGNHWVGRVDWLNNESTTSSWR